MFNNKLAARGFHKINFSEIFQISEMLNYSFQGLEHYRIIICVIVVLPAMKPVTANKYR